MRTLLVACVFLLGAAKPEHACPEQPPKNAKARRELAGSWFERGKALQQEQHYTDAVKAYACSMRIVPHAFTAFNLAKAAESAGDLELAVESYRQYLELTPNPTDRAEVETRIVQLQSELERHRAEVADAKREEPPKKVDPPPELPAVVEHEPAPEPKPPLVVETPVVEREAPRVLPWIAGAGGVALTGVGVALNLIARDRASESNDLFMSDRPRSDELHSQAKTFAYGSYALIGSGAVAIAGAIALFIVD